jgi:putative exporter of polyketide antibiotics
LPLGQQQVAAARQRKRVDIAFKKRHERGAEDSGKSELLSQGGISRDASLTGAFVTC